MVKYSQVSLIGGYGMGKKQKVHSLIDKVYERRNLYKAWALVKANGGCGGVDEVSTGRFEKGLEENIEGIHQELRDDTYTPQPVERVWIPKADGSKRPLGIPTIRDRVVQQALYLKLDSIFEPHFSDCSYGFRPGKSAHQAIREVANGIREGYSWVVEVDIKGYFDTIDHERLIDFVAERVADGRVLKLIRKFLKSGVMEEMKVRAQTTGTPQGGVISPLLANVYLNHYDWKMKEQGYRLVRYADDFVILCKSYQGAVSAKRLTEKIIEGELGLKLHPEKTRVVNMRKGFEFLGFYFGMGRSLYIMPRMRARDKLTEKVKQITKRSNPWSVAEMIEHLNRALRGWANYFRIGNIRSLCWRFDRWIARRVRAFISKKWRTTNWMVYTSKILYGKLGVVSLYSVSLGKSRR